MLHTKHILIILLGIICIFSISFDSLLKTTLHPEKETTIIGSKFPRKAVNQSTCDQGIQQSGEN